MKNFKKDFNLLAENDIVYLDSAATTQRPQVVLDSMLEFHNKYNANPHRGIYNLSVEATNCYENAREVVAEFINADVNEIIFTKNATESLNLLAYSYGLDNISKNDKVVISILEHHSNIVPWQKVTKQNNGILEYIYINDNMELIDFEEKITSDTKIVSITYISNVLGVINPIEKIIKKAHSVGAIVIIDASQSVPHIPLDVKALDVDFVVFSAHKLMGPLGVGVLYGKFELLDKMTPFLLGGDMIESVSEQETTFAPVPQKFEAGTQNVSGVVGLSSAIKYLKSVSYETIHSIESELLAYAKSRLNELSYVSMYAPKENDNQIGVISFNINGIHAHDVAEVLNNLNICIRVGHHCAKPLMNFLNIQSTCRISFYIYNTKEDIDKFIDGIEKTYARFEKWL